MVARLYSDFMCAHLDKKRFRVGWLYLPIYRFGTNLSFVQFIAVIWLFTKSTDMGCQLRSCCITIEVKTGRSRRWIELDPQRLQRWAAEVVFTNEVNFFSS